MWHVPAMWGECVHENRGVRATKMRWGHNEEIIGMC
jgi:hypothetical protein